MVMICQFVTPLAPPQIPPPLILQLLNLVSQILVIQHLVLDNLNGKRLKFKHELTRNILDLNYAKKSILSQPLSFPLYNDGGEGELPNEKYCYDNDDENNSGISSGSTDNKSINSKLESTQFLSQHQHH